MYDTENPVPRNGEGRRRRPTAAFRNIGVGVGALGAGAGVGYAGLKVGKAAEDWQRSSPAFIARKAKFKTKAAWGKLRSILKLKSELREIQLAAGEYARKYLAGEPLLARKGEEGYDPNVEREVKAALLHRQPPSESAQKRLTREARRKVLRTETVRREGPAGKFTQRIVKIVSPYSKIRSQISSQQRGLTSVPEKIEVPPEHLPKQRGKIPVRGASYEGADVPDLWSREEAGKPTKIKYIYPERQHPHQRKPLTPEEVSIRAREHRDPLASHYARVRAGLTPSMTVKREKAIAGLPSTYLPKAQDIEERRQAQALRDYLASRVKTLRGEVIKPLRAQTRRQAGLAPIKPLKKTEMKGIRAASEKMGDFPIAEGTPFRKPEIKPMIPIGGKQLHPAVIRRAHQELQSRIKAVTDVHAGTAESIRKNIHDRLQENFAKAQTGKVLRDTANRLTNETFSPNRTSMEDWEVKVLAEHTATTPEWIQKQHQAFVKHTHLGSTQVGEDKIRRALTHKVFAGIPGGEGGPAKAAYPALKRLGKRTAIGAGIAGALGAGAYALRRRQRRIQETQFAVPGAVRRIQGKLKGWRIGKVGKHELVIGGSLAGGITAADALTSAVFPDPEKTRKQSAWAGAKRGAVYGSALAGVEPLLRIPLSKRLKLASKLREVRFARGDQVLKIMPNMSLPRIAGDSLEAVARNKPEILAKYGGTIEEAKEAIREQRPIMARQINQIRKQRHLSRNLDKVLKHLDDLKNMSSRVKLIQFQNQKDKPSFKRDVAVGGIEGGLGYLATDRLLRKFAPRTAGGRFAVAAGVGGLSTGTIGYGLNRFLRSRRKQNPTLMAAKLKEIQFQEWADIPSPGRRNRRLSVAQDRYKKVIREREIQRKEANLAKSAVAGAALAGAVHGKLKLPLKHALVGGAAAGVGTQAALMLRGRRTKDPYGEESIASKRIQRLPYQVGGGAAAAVLAHKLYKHFAARGKVIRFQQFIPTDAPPVPWHVREATRWIKHPQSRVEHAQKWIGRAGRIRRDIELPKTAKGEIIDERGRVRQPEWKKDWFKRSVLGGAAVGSLLGAAVLHRRIKSSAVTAAGLMEKGLAPTQGERLALNLASGNVTRAVKEKFRSKFPRFVRGAKGIGGLGQEFRQAKENLLARANIAVEGQTGRITGAKIKRSKTGDILGVEVENPAKARENLAKIQAEEERISKRAEQLRRQRERVKGTQGTRGRVEKIIKKPEENFQSKLKTINFQEVYVRPHTRSPRRQKRKTETKNWREGFLIGGGLGLGGLGVGGGIAYKGRQKKFTEEAEERIAKRVAQELGKVRIHKLRSRLDDLIEFKELSKEKRRARWGAAAGGIGGTVSGGVLGGYMGTLHPEAVGAYTGEAMQHGLKRGLESMEEELGEGWKPSGYGKHEPFSHGAFGPAEAKARQRLLERKVLNKRVLKRIGKYAAIGSVGMGTLGAASGYAASRAGMHHTQRNLSAKLDDIIAFK